MSQTIKLIQEEIDNLNRSISIKRIKLTINNLHKKEAPDLDYFHSEFYHTLKKEIIPILHKYFHKIKAVGTF